MFNHKYISLKVIIDKIMRGKYYKELPYESAIDYGVEAYRLLATEKAEITLPAKIEIKEYRGRLPENLERIVQTAKTDCNLKCFHAMRYATDSFNSVLHCIDSVDMKCQSEFTYSLNNNYIHPNFKDGFVFMVYKGLAVDDDCIPMIPDNVNVKLAIEYYIKSRFLDDLGSEDNLVIRRQEKDEQEYCWYIGKAQASITDLSIDEYESFANSMSKFFGDGNQHSSFMKNLGSQEFRRNIKYG